MSTTGNIAPLPQSWYHALPHKKGKTGSRYDLNKIIKDVKNLENDTAKFLNLNNAQGLKDVAARIKECKKKASSFSADFSKKEAKASRKGKEPSSSQLEKRKTINDVDKKVHELLEKITGRLEANCRETNLWKDSVKSLAQQQAFLHLDLEQDGRTLIRKGSTDTKAPPSYHDTVKEIRSAKASLEKLTAEQTSKAETLHKEMEYLNDALIESRKMVKSGEKRIDDTPTREDLLHRLEKDWGSDWSKTVKTLAVVTGYPKKGPESGSPVDHIFDVISCRRSRRETEQRKRLVPIKICVRDYFASYRTATKIVPSNRQPASQVAKRIFQEATTDQRKALADQKPNLQRRGAIADQGKLTDE